MIGTLALPEASEVTGGKVRSPTVKIRVTPAARASTGYLMLPTSGIRKKPKTLPGLAASQTEMSATCGNCVAGGTYRAL